MVYIVGFSGSQKGMTVMQLVTFYQIISDIKYVRWEFHHGDDSGADSDADYIVRKYARGAEVHLHIPTDRSRGAFCEKRGPTILYPPKSFLSRNKDIVKPTNLMIFTPGGPEVLRSGTWSTIRFADKREKEIWIIMPDGQVERRNVTSTSQSR